MNKINVLKMKMLRLPKYKEYFALSSIWIIASFLTFVLYVVFFLKHNHETIKIFSTLSLILLGFFLVYIIINKSINVNLLQLILGRNPERNVIIIGDGISGKKLSEKLNAENTLGINIIGQIHDFSNIKNLLENSFKKEKIDEILISIDNKNYDELLDIVDICNNFHADIKVSSELFRIIPQKIKINKYYDIPVINVKSSNKSSVYFQFKRSVDVLLSLFGFVALSPVFLIIMLSIKLSSSGPIFYKQKRVGLNGKLFDLYKFRSMYLDNGEDNKREKMMLDFMKNNKAEKIIDDARVTKVGKFIRRTSLDELPQLYNVIKGNMSIVGPRPCLPYEFNNYAEWQKRRVKVLPGCTGVWQVSGRSSVSFTDSIILDLFYINNMTPLYDIILILKTIPVIFFSKGGV